MSSGQTTAVNTVASSELGRQTEYPDSYNPDLLFSLPRSGGRAELGIAPDHLPFSGFDLWTAYELSWLDLDGKPFARIAEFAIPCNSDNIIESKSLKLYLNSLNQEQFDSPAKLHEILERDLSLAAGGPVLVDFYTIDDYSRRGLQPMPGDCLDDMPLKVDQYLPDASLLELDDGPVVSETLHSHLLKTNCPVTGQPDWASVLVRYRGSPINRASLLRYLISFRGQQDFHEQCIERIFVELLEVCQPYELEVCGRYTRRGGLDINPCRSTGRKQPERLRTARQ